jgi:hypothetical protein
MSCMKNRLWYCYCMMRQENSTKRMHLSLQKEKNRIIAQHRVILHYFYNDRFPINTNTYIIKITQKTHTRRPRCYSKVIRIDYILYSWPVKIQFQVRWRQCKFRVIFFFPSSDRAWATDHEKVFFYPEEMVLFGSKNTKNSNS